MGGRAAKASSGLSDNFLSSIVPLESNLFQINWIRFESNQFIKKETKKSEKIEDQ